MAKTRRTAGQSVLGFRTDGNPDRVTWDPWRDGSTKVYGFAGRFATRSRRSAIAEFSGVTILVPTTGISSARPDPTLYPNTTDRGGGGPIGDHTTRASGDVPGRADVRIERAVDPSLTLGLKATYRSLGRGLESRCDFPSAGIQLLITNPRPPGRTRGGCAGHAGFDPLDGARQVAPRRPPNASTAARALVRKSIGQSLWRGDYYSSLRATTAR
jgi:hypothetical protein